MIKKGVGITDAFEASVFLQKLHYPVFIQVKKPVLLKIQLCSLQITMKAETVYKLKNFIEISRL
jgi:hypothetical protein